jgi:hypothetical protein
VWMREKINRFYGFMSRISSPCTGNRLARVFPSFGKGGVAAPLIKYREASLAAQTGWFVQATE